uniref:Uncharacterized protein n=1 Tax=Trichuris muris TaxID=70415 RepID=A0A5S6Q833_TRIMR
MNWPAFILLLFALTVSGLFNNPRKKQHNVGFDKQTPLEKPMGLEKAAQALLTIERKLSNKFKFNTTVPKQRSLELGLNERSSIAKTVLMEMNVLLNRNHFYSLALPEFVVKCGTREDDTVMARLVLRQTDCQIKKVLIVGSDEGCNFNAHTKYVTCTWEGTILNGQVGLTYGLVCYGYWNKAIRNNNNTSTPESICVTRKYEDSRLYRLLAPFDKRQWSDKLLLYAPPTYKPDCENGICANDERSSLKREHLTGDDVIVRAGEERLPLNPLGRTGVAGPGVLKTYGPYFLMMPLITRANKGRYEVFVDLTEWSNGKRARLPQSYTRDPEKNFLGEPLTRNIEHILARTRGEPWAKLTLHAMYILANKKKHILFNGVVPDMRNTDNSWVQIVHTAYMDKYQKRLGSYDFNAEEEQLGYGWRPVENITVDNEWYESVLPEKLKSYMDKKRKSGKTDTVNIMGETTESAVRQLSDIMLYGRDKAVLGVVNSLGCLSIVAELFSVIGTILAQLYPKKDKPPA